LCIDAQQVDQLIDRMTIYEYEAVGKWL